MVQPLVARGSRVALYVAVCVSVGALLSAALAGRSEVTLLQATAVVLPLSVLYGFVCLSSVYVCRATPLRSSTGATILTNIGGATLFAAALWLALARALAWAVSHVPSLAGTDRLFAGESVLLFAVGALVYLLTTAAHYVFIGMDEARATEQRALEAQLTVREAELKALRAQIEPHFLFNSLNSISALTTADPAGARHMCLLLAEFLRASLTLGARDRIPLADEMGMALRFLEIERVRFGTRLAIQQSVEENAAACLVPPLLLQPLAENAVNHGIAGLLKGGVVRLAATRDNGLVRIVIENPCDVDRPRKSRAGVGLENVRRRLASQYGGLARLQVEDGGDLFRAVITLPVSDSTRT